MWPHLPTPAASRSSQYAVGLCDHRGNAARRDTSKERMQIIHLIRIENIHKHAGVNLIKQFSIQV